MLRHPDSERLKPFTRALVGERHDLQHRVLLMSSGGILEVLEWQDIESDAKIITATLTQALLQLVAKDTFQRVIPPGSLLPMIANTGELESGLLATRLFSQLNDPEIKVTPGHTGTTPFRHSMRVLEFLQRSSAMELWEVLCIFFTGVFHDVGKGLSAGVPEIEELMDAYKEQKITPTGVLEKSQPHSHPDHAIISVLFLQALLRTEAFSAFVKFLHDTKLFPMEKWHDVLLLIRHHHGFEELLKNPESKGFAFEQLVLLFYFKFADTCSTPAYQKDWPAAVEQFEGWLKDSGVGEQGVDHHYWLLAQEALGLGVV